MKKVMTIAMVLGFSMQARADGFVCESEREALKVQIYNHTEPTLGTRNPAVMVVSDTSVQEGRKTIARFSDCNGTLTKKAAQYVADVDLRRNDSNRKGELIAGTKLGALDSLVLDVNFSYGYPMEAGEVTDGELTLVKRNGETISVDMECTRYLKN